MSLTRRKTLAVLGGGLILAAGGTGYRLTRTPDAALAPWTAAGGYGDPLGRDPELLGCRRDAPASFLGIHFFNHGQDLGSFRLRIPPALRLV